MRVLSSSEARKVELVILTSTIVCADSIFEACFSNKDVRRWSCLDVFCVKNTSDRVKILNKGLNSAKTVSTLPSCSLIRCFRERESICSVIDLENVIKKKRTKSLGVS